MPWRLIGTIAIVAVLLFFIGLNLGEESTSNLSLGFLKFEKVPVYLTVFVSFILGMLFSLPFFIFRKKPKKEKSLLPREKQTKGKKILSNESVPETQEAVPEATKEGSSYGID